MKFFKFIFSILITCIIFYLCIMQLPDETPPAFRIPHFDKIVHMLMYFGLTGMLYVEYFKYSARYTWKQAVSFLINGRSPNGIKPAPIHITPYILLSGISLAYGGLIEIIQENFSAFRTGDWQDFMADAAGVIFAFILFLIIKQIRFNSKK